MSYKKLTTIPPGEIKEISTDAGMTAVLTSDNVGKCYKFVGTTGTYTNGDLYVVEENTSTSSGTVGIAVVGMAIVGNN